MAEIGGTTHFSWYTGQIGKDPQKGCKYHKFETTHHPKPLAPRSKWDDENLPLARFLDWLNMIHAHKQATNAHPLHSRYDRTWQMCFDFWPDDLARCFFWTSVISACFIGSQGYMPLKESPFLHFGGYGGNSQERICSSTTVGSPTLSWNYGLQNLCSW